MSRVISFRDLIAVVPALKGYTEIELLDLGMDKIVNEALGQLGFNLNAAILYVPAKHRDLANKVGVGYRAVGEISQDRAFLNSSVCLPIERLIAASQYDMSLTKELAKLMGTTTADLRDTAIMDVTSWEEDPKKSQEYIEDDHDQVEREIRQLEKIRDEIRGDKYNAHGALKSPREYAEDLEKLTA